MDLAEALGDLRHLLEKKPCHCSLKPLVFDKFKWDRDGSSRVLARPRRGLW